MIFLFFKYQVSRTLKDVRVNNIHEFGISGVEMHGARHVLEVKSVGIEASDTGDIVNLGSCVSVQVDNIRDIEWQDSRNTCIVTFSLSWLKRELIAVQ